MEDMVSKGTKPLYQKHHSFDGFSSKKAVAIETQKQRALGIIHDAVQKSAVSARYKEIVS